MKFGSDAIGFRKYNKRQSRKIKPRKVVIALDRDDTVSIGDGPIPLNLIQELKLKGFFFVAIGNQKLTHEAYILSGRIGKTGFTLSKTKRKEIWLGRLKRSLPHHVRFIVVDNSRIRAKGWEYLSPNEFLSQFRE